MKKFIIDGLTPILGDDEKPLGNHTIATTLLDVLWKNSTHDAMKCYDFGAEMKRQKKLELDESDFRFVEECVKGCTLIAMFKAPLMRAFNAAKDGADKPDK